MVCLKFFTRLTNIEQTQRRKTLKNLTNFMNRLIEILNNKGVSLNVFSTTFQAFASKTQFLFRISS